MRLLVCGGRDYNNESEVEYQMSLLNMNGKKIDLVIAGAARGADTLAVKWARDEGIKVLEFPITKSDWKTFGNGAGPMRNLRMLLIGKPDHVLAFPGGKGTANMVKLARERGVPVTVVTAPKQAEPPYKQPRGL